MNKIKHDSGEYKYFGKTYYDGQGDTCPLCGSKIKHPYIGMVSEEQLEEDFKCCLWGEAIDECGSTLGYVPICRNINKKCKNM